MRSKVGVKNRQMNKWLKWVLIFIGSFCWSLTIFKSGIFYKSLGANGAGLGFWGANGHDGIWHIALAEGLARGSYTNPVFAGHSLQNYHIGFDLLLSFLNKITLIPIPSLYFQVIPLVLALLIGFLTFKFVFEWVKSEKAAFYSTFFVYFGGSMAWIIGKGESAFWSQQSISTLINPPYALSLVLILVGLITLKNLESKFTIQKFILSIFIFGVLIAIKSYAGLLCLGALFVSGVYSLIINKKYYLFKIFLLSLILAICLYIPINRSSINLLVFQPFWFLETLMSASDKMDWQKFASAMSSYKSGNNYIKGIPAYLIAFTIFILGNFGTRIVFIFKKIKLNELNIFIYSVVLAGIVIPMLFLQKGTPWNTIQFLYYSLFFASILSGVLISKINKKILIYSVILFTIPTTILALRDVYIPSRPPAMLPVDEVHALEFLSNEPDGTVLTIPFNEASALKAIDNPPRPLYLYATTSYVSAFSRHPTFIEDEINLEIMNYDWKSRKEMSLDWWYTEKDTTKKRNFLNTNKIKYVYLIKRSMPSFDSKGLNLSSIYENGLVNVYKVD